MKYKLKLIGAGIFLWIGLSQQIIAQEFIRPLTLDECISIGLKNSYEIKNAAMEKQISKAQVGETRAQGLPQINGEVQATGNFLVPFSFLPAQLVDPTAPEGDFIPVQFSPAVIGQAAVTLSQLVVDGSYFVGLRAANTYKELAEKDYQRTKIDVVEAITKAYYGVMVNEERLELIDVNLNRLDSLMRETEILFQNGFASRLDVNRLKVSINNLSAQKNRIERLYDVSVQLLKFQMGIDINMPLEIAEKIQDVSLDEELIREEFFDVSKRIEYDIFQTNLKLTDLQLSNIRAQYYPSLSVFAQVGANTAGSTAKRLIEFDNYFEFGAVGATLKIPVFDGLRKNFQSQQIKVKRLQVENQLNQFKSSAELQVNQAYINLESILEELENQRENLELALEVTEQAKLEFKAGLGSNIEVINAESAFKEAENNYYNTLYDALIAKVELKKALGILNVNE